MPAVRTDLIPDKTYATEDNLVRAVNMKLGHLTETLRYHVAWTRGGRCYPIFMHRNAVEHGVHFHFCVIA